MGPPFGFALKPRRSALNSFLLICTARRHSGAPFVFRTIRLRDDLDRSWQSSRKLGKGLEGYAEFGAVAGEGWSGVRADLGRMESGARGVIEAGHERFESLADGAVAHGCRGCEEPLTWARSRAAAWARRAGSLKC